MHPNTLQVCVKGPHITDNPAHSHPGCKKIPTSKKAHNALVANPYRVKSHIHTVSSFVGSRSDVFYPTLTLHLPCIKLALTALTQPSPSLNCYTPTTILLPIPLTCPTNIPHSPTHTLFTPQLHIRCPTHQHTLQPHHILSTFPFLSFHPFCHTHLTSALWTTYSHTLLRCYVPYLHHLYYLPHHTPTIHNTPSLRSS